MFQSCRGKLLRKSEDKLPSLHLLEEHGYIRQIVPKNYGAGRPTNIRTLLNPVA